MRVVFMGSPACACPSLDALLAMPGIQVVAVVTQPDRPQGRGLHLQPCAVKAHAVEQGLAVLTPANVNHPDVVGPLAALKPDVIVVVAFGQIMKRAILDLAPLGCVNVHASLLPRYRGAAPAQWALVNGESVTGVTTMLMNERLDAGEMLLKREVTIMPDDTGGSLLMKLGRAGAALLPGTLEGLQDGTLRGEAQDDRMATLAPKMSKGHGVIVWTMPAADIERRVRAFHPWPCCTCETPRGSGQTLRVLKARVELAHGAPGSVLKLDGEGPLIAAGEGALRLLEVQPAGRKAMSGLDYARGRHLAAGDVLG